MTKWTVLVAAVVVVSAGCGGSAVPSGPVELDKLRDAEIPVYYLGESFAGLDLTYADTSGEHEVMLVYGTCETPGGLFSDGGCAPPLQIHSCSGSDVVVMYGRSRLTRRASRSLRPLNDAARRMGKPYVQIDYGGGCGL